MSASGVVASVGEGASRATADALRRLTGRPSAGVVTDAVGGVALAATDPWCLGVSRGPAGVVALVVAGDPCRGARTRRRSPADALARMVADGWDEGGFDGLAGSLRRCVADLPGDHVVIAAGGEALRVAVATRGMSLVVARGRRWTTMASTARALPPGARAARLTADQPLEIAGGGARRAPVPAPPEPEAQWEVTLLRRPARGRAARVGDRIRVAAPSAGRARAAASCRHPRFAPDGSTWSVGLLRPLEAALPGTHLYRVVFAVWVEGRRAYRREDVLSVEVWATDADSARRIAAREAEARPDYRGAWRIRRAERIASPAGETARAGPALAA